MTVLPMMVHTLAPWQTLFANSSAISTTVTTVHITALLLGGGLAIAADRTTLRALRSDAWDWNGQLAELHAVHRPVTAMLVLLFASGVLLAAADVETFASSVLFWIKLALITLLLINGGVLYSTEQQLSKQVRHSAPPSSGLRRRLKRTALFSVTLWVATAVVGTVLTSS